MVRTYEMTSEIPETREETRNESKTSDSLHSLVVNLSETAPNEQSSIKNRKLKILFRLLSFLEGNWHRVASQYSSAPLTIGSSVALMGTSAWLISTAAFIPPLRTSASPSLACASSVLHAAFSVISNASSRTMSPSDCFHACASGFTKSSNLSPARLMDFRAGDLLARIIGDVETLENFYVRVVSPPLTAIIVGLFTSIFSHPSTRRLLPFS